MRGVYVSVCLHVCCVDACRVCGVYVSVCLHVCCVGAC